MKSTSEKSESDSVHLAAPDGQVPTAVCEQPSVEVAGAAPTQQGKPAEKRVTPYTSGPWEFFTLLSASENDRGFRVVSGANKSESVGRWVADVSPINDSHGDASEEGRANARLIAAAPELLEALQMLYAEAADYITLNNLGGMDNHSMKLARSAIASATGEKA